jgi:hypothetical protein
MSAAVRGCVRRQLNVARIAQTFHNESASLLSYGIAGFDVTWFDAIACTPAPN